MDNNQYKPSNTWLLDAIRLMGQCEVDSMHLFIYLLTNEEQSEKVVKAIQRINETRRHISALIKSKFPEFKDSLACATNKHTPAIMVLSYELRTAVGEDPHILMAIDAIHEAQSLLTEECYGISLKIGGCIECLADVNI